MSTLEIRRVPREELEQAYSIVQEYYAAANVVARESREEFQCDYFRDASGIWMATVDGNIAGCIALRTLPQLGPRCGEIKRMYLRPQYRGQGIAEALLRSLEIFAARCGYAELYLDTAADMAAAARLYEKNGYKKCPRYNENPQAAIFMKKRIASGGHGVPKK